MYDHGISCHKSTTKDESSADRMPVPLGMFISKHVYDGRLKTQHLVKTRDAVQFIDVPGTEEQPGQSWVVRLFRPEHSGARY
jgi:hypothetical protein